MENREDWAFENSELYVLQDKPGIYFIHEDVSILEEKTTKVFPAGFHTTLIDFIFSSRVQGQCAGRMA